jgi:hypothetical protein
VTPRIADVRAADAEARLPARRWLLSLFFKIEIKSLPGQPYAKVEVIWISSK